ncbi:PIN domain-containing protein [Methylobacterium sp. J-030]|uniref:type II toxin-antitoxin system VapC family toxin n=1 Tax=Methylobacterium sp. J-030 TaxID=2836627 RepID=UPI001FBA520E|nr:PIN domain-containing protein [Methylobacterium sp. J-030]MCJ2073170.1 PIN domain-containing protein [Methylobacterium sp. J-030]
MIVIDTNVWIDHLRNADPVLIALLGDGRPRVHPDVIGEFALGTLRDRTTVLTFLERMPRAQLAEPDEVMRLISDHALHGLGLGDVDAHRLASAKLMPGSRIRTRDRRLAAVSDRLGLSCRATP